MPAFHTHWNIALRAIAKAPDYVQSGWALYRARAGDFRRMIMKELNAVTSESQVRQFEKAAHSEAIKWEQSIGAHRTNKPKPWFLRLFEDIDADAKYAPCRDDVTCFSAYMLGACGPDFWVCPSNPRIKIPDVALDQFNMGHYNRTFRQFQASACSVGSDDSLQSRVQKAYFYGMATHLAADLVVHELVNVSAGAYNLLHQLWYSEQTDFLGKLKTWQMHNKVEHYWDTWVRYGLLGDRPDGDDATFFAKHSAGAKTLGFLTCDTLLAMVEEKESSAARAALRKVIETDEFRCLVEKPFTFPFVFCDRVVAGKDLNPFLYRVVIEKAHPEDDLHPVIAKERKSYQMQDGHGQDYSEKKKCAFFASKDNATSDKAYSWNYLAYVVGPNLEKLQRFGADVFYDLAALDAFAARAASVAPSFMKDLADAYQAVDPHSPPALDAVRLPNLGRFWNLDTGLGLVVKNQTKATCAESVTLLDFVHVWDVEGAGTLAYKRPARNEGYMQLHADETGADRFFGYPQRAFDLREPKLFNGWADIEEPDAKAFFPRLDVGDMRERSLRDEKDEESFMFDGKGSTACEKLEVSTKSLAAGTQKCEVTALPNRLTLWLRVAIAPLGAAPSEVGVFLHGDGAKESMKAENDWSGMAKEKTESWMQEGDAKPLEFQAGEVNGARSASGGTALQEFSVRLLANFEQKNLDPKLITIREVAQKKWNNVIPFDEHKPAYGRNYAIGTGRKHVLHSVNMEKGQVFNPRPNGDYKPLTLLPKIIPTEQVFLALHVLVKRLDGRVFDVMTKKEVEREQMKEIRRIDAAGFVKVVLYYVVTPKGPVQLKTCHIDGVRVAVEEVS